MSMYILSYIAGGPAYFDFTFKKDLPFAFFLIYQAGKESFLRQILLSNLRLNAYEWKQTKI